MARKVSATTGSEHVGKESVPNDYVSERFSTSTSASGKSGGDEEFKEMNGMQLGGLFKRLRIVRHSEKGIGGEALQLNHLGLYVDTEDVSVLLTREKLTRMHILVHALMIMAQKTPRHVPLELGCTFCGVCVSFTLVHILACFLTQILYLYMIITDKESTVVLCLRRNLGRRRQSSGAKFGESTQPLPGSTDRVRRDILECETLPQCRIVAREGSDVSTCGTCSFRFS